MKNAKIAISLTVTVTTLNAFGVGLCLNIFYEFVHLNVLQPPASRNTGYQELLDSIFTEAATAWRLQKILRCYHPGQRC